MVHSNMAIAPARLAAQRREQIARRGSSAATANVKYIAEAVAEPNRTLREEVRFRTHAVDHKHPLRFAGCNTAEQLQRKLELIREGEGAEY